jgi:pyridoxine 5-phosphate synthase
MIHLGVNIDHVATVRQARRAQEPDPIVAALLAESGGAHGITVHLRQDRRHIQEHDVRRLRTAIKGILNLEMAVGEDVLGLALEVVPDQVCLVPEHRAELTTEGGLLLASDRDQSALVDCVKQLQAKNILVSMFIEPDIATLKHARDAGANAVELHTGSWANAWAACAGNPNDAGLRTQIQRLENAADAAEQLGLRLHAGHGINYANVRDLLHLVRLQELNIGHSIVARALMVGMMGAVREMRELIDAGPVKAQKSR